MKSTKPLFTVDGFEVHPERIYTVSNKSTKNAPTGFIRENTTKLPSVGVGDVFSFRFVDGVWDTGFHEFSPCYKGRETAEVRKMVKERVENILIPYQKATGRADEFDVSNPESLDRPNFSIEADKVFTTNSPKDLMELYAALLTKKLTPVEKHYSPEYRDSAYLVEDGTKENKRKNEDAVTAVKVQRKFLDLYTKNPETLHPILSWLRVDNIGEGIDEDTATAIFIQKVGGDKTKLKQFLEIVQDVEKESSGFLKYYIHHKLAKMRGKSSDLRTAANGRLYYKDIEIGPDIYTASELIALNPELKGIREEILESGKKAVKIT